MNHSLMAYEDLDSQSEAILEEPTSLDRKRNESSLVLPYRHRELVAAQDDSLYDLGEPSEKNVVQAPVHARRNYVVPQASRHGPQQSN